MPVSDPFDLLVSPAPGALLNSGSAYTSNVPDPQVGAIHSDTDGKILIYSGEQDGWKEVGNWHAANWNTMYYVFKASGTDDNIGIWSGSLDKHNVPSTWTVHAKDDKFYALDANTITREEYETQIAFETMPIMDIERESQAGVLLKFPD